MRFRKTDTSSTLNITLAHRAMPARGTAGVESMLDPAAAVLAEPVLGGRSTVRSAAPLGESNPPRISTATAGWKSPSQDTSSATGHPTAGRCDRTRRWKGRQRFCCAAGSPGVIPKDRPNPVLSSGQAIARRQRLRREHLRRTRRREKPKRERNKHPFHVSPF